MNFYKSTKWIHKREKILRRDKYECQECKRYGKTIEAKTVHHIHPLEIRPEMGLINKNLISLCNKCHEGMHNRQTSGLSEDGLRLLERVAPPTPE
ncbi:MAG TPA: HNH endonuclease [Clostridiales bacterium]|nr:MAG: HNH endonuclease [Clostridiales bacterium GWD2_32_59]HAN09373.1 HNH endonuclease [Clostridiales bacterium]